MFQSQYEHQINLKSTNEVGWCYSMSWDWVFSDLLSLLSSYVFDVFFGFFKATRHNTTPITGISEKTPSRSSTICGQSTCGVGQHVRVHPWNCLGIPGNCVRMCMKNGMANLGMPRSKKPDKTFGGFSLAELYELYLAYCYHELCVWIHKIFLKPVQPAPTDVLSLDSLSGYFVGVDILGFLQKHPYYHGGALVDRSNHSETRKAF